MDNIRTESASNLGSKPGPSKHRLLSACSTNESRCLLAHSVPVAKCVKPLPIFIEACCGSAILSFEVKKRGFSVLPVDWINNKHDCKLSAVKLDLSSSEQVSILKQLIAQGPVEIVWAAVPCGTASKAREIKLPNGEKGPKPLRSQAFPEGLPGLSPINQARVHKANEVYDRVADLLQFALSHSCFVIVENPRGSYLWDYKWYRHMISLPGFVDVDYQHCRWTPLIASRPKWTRLRTNMKSLLQMSGKCELDHVHLGWGRDVQGNFVTAGESEYHAGMCSVVSDIFAREISARGWELVPEQLNPDFKKADGHKKRRAVASKQPRGKFLPPLLPEYKNVEVMTKLDAEKASAKILRIVLPSQISPEGVSGLFKENQIPLSSEARACIGELPDDAKVVAGTFRTPEEFFDLSTSAVHPLDLDGAIPDELTEALCQALSMSTAEYVKHLLHKTRDLIKLSEQCSEEDRKIADALPGYAKRISNGKKFATMQKILKATNHPDKTLVNDMISGFSVVGMSPYTSSFDYEVSLPSRTIGELRQLSPVSNAAILGRVGPTKDAQADLKLWELTEEEVDNGWLLGKFYNLQDVEGVVQGYPHISRRFPLNQGAKVRPIDDFLESNVNTAWGSHERLVLLDADSLAAMVRAIEKVFLQGGHEFTLRSGEICRCTLHPSWQAAGAWQGRTIDLKSAYKQLFVHPSQLWATVISVYDPIRKQPCILPEGTLPFGAAASVHHFNRASRFLWRYMVVENFLLWTNFFDDFPTLAASSVSKSCDAAISIFLKCVGWSYSDNKEKDLPFAEAFNALGIRFDVSRISEGLSTVENRRDRVDKVSSIVEAIIADGTFFHHQAESLRGKVQFMERSIFGKAGKSISRVYQRRGRAPALTDRDAMDLRWLIVWLSTAVPRRLSPDAGAGTVLIFCDGACEYECGKALVTCGAILYDGKSDVVHCFGIRINDELTAEWRLEGKEQLVTEAEIFPILISRVIWASFLRSAKVITFVDSNPALYSCIRGDSLSENCSNIVKAISHREAELSIWSWFSRVPTLSNCADHPSRLKKMPEIWNGKRVVEYSVVQPRSLRDGIWESEG